MCTEPNLQQTSPDEVVIEILDTNDTIEILDTDPEPPLELILMDIDDIREEWVFVGSQKPLKSHL